MVRGKVAYPFPAELYEGFADESEYRIWLADKFREFGWDAWEEVKSNDGTSRADLVVEKEPWGVIGIELKYADKLTPRYWAGALKQIKKYESKSFGLGIDNWAVGSDQSELAGRRHQQAMRNYEVFKQFFNVLGYGWLRTERVFSIVFNYSNPAVKVPIADIGYKYAEMDVPSAIIYERRQTKEAIDYVRQLEGVFCDE